MNHRIVNTILALSLVLLLCFGLIGCAKLFSSPTAEAEGGALRLKVNPEFLISYDEQGNVVSVEARNREAKEILAVYPSYAGKDCSTVVTELVTLIGENGYFVEEIEGVRRSITLEIEYGTMPTESFLDEIAANVQSYVNANAWNGEVELFEADTDYGPNADGVTDYDDTDYGPNADGVTDYDDTDYGPNADGVTDYDDTDYGPNADGVTDYDDTDYGPNADGVTDYDDSDYGPNADGVTDYDDSDYGKTDYDDSDYGKTDYVDSDYNG